MAGGAVVERVVARLGKQSAPFELETPDGRTVRVGTGEPQFRAKVRNRAGMRALASLSELEMAEAYMRGDIDIDGSLLTVMELRAGMTDNQPLIRLWARLHPKLVGRTRTNPGWIAKHYDIANVQLLAADQDYNTYTPGLYESDDDTLEAGAERKLAWAFSHLKLEEGDSVLDVGCGWGGFSRYCAARGVEVTGITLSRDQLAFGLQRLQEDGLHADLRFQDAFTFEPGRQFDAISVMGVIEDLSDYDRTFGLLKQWLAPGGRIYLDFAAADVRFGIASFITKHVWPGTFRLVYMPEFMEALAKHELDAEVLVTDRRNYHLWTKKGYERLVERHDEVIAAADESTFRTLGILYASCAHIFGPTSTKGSAYRVVIRPRTSTYLPRSERAREPSQAQAQALEA